MVRRAEEASPNGHDLHEHEAPELTSGDADIADVQLALGRPELADAVPPVQNDAADATQLEALGDEAGFEALEDRVDDAEEAFEETGEGEQRTLDGELVQRTPRRGRAPAQRDGSRLANFLRGSWRELERVQWPDRRQVGQATAVVVGFVIVAGAFLGLMDVVASKVVDLII